MTVQDEQPTYFLTSGEVAEILRLSESTVRRQAVSGDIPGGFRHGKRWLFRRRDFMPWIEGPGDPIEPEADVCVPAD